MGTGTTTGGNQAPDPSADGSHVPGRHQIEPLWWIGAYKLLKALLALVGGLMVLRLMHRDLPALALHYMERLDVDPESKLGVLVLRQILRISDRRIQWVAAGLFAYVPLAIAEGAGLMARKYWAEWLTVITTAALVPLEVHHLIRRPTLARTLILVLNLLVVAYLVVRIRRDRRRHARRNAQALSAPSPDPPSGGRQTQGREN